MEQAPRRTPLERAIQLSIVVTVFGSMLASGSILDWLAVGRKLRWVGLGALVVLACAYAYRRGARLHPRLPYLLVAALGVLCVVSAAWSADPRSSLTRGGAFALVLAAAALLGAAGGGRLALEAALAAIALVAVAGLVVLAFEPSRAVQEATPREPARYQGFGGNPNSATLLLAFGLPLGAAWAASTRARLGRIGLLAVVALCAASIAASGSRGALLAGFGGLAVVAALGVLGTARRTAAVAGVAVAAVLALGAGQIPQPDPDASVPRARDVGPAETGDGALNAEAFLPLEDELGHPPFGVAAQEERSTLLGSSGRAQAWDWTVRHGAERPLLGNGFGAEDEAYVDRLSAFQGDTPENGYLGLFLQLGLVGLAVFVAFAASVALPTRRARDGGWAAIGAAGAVACGLIVALAQSFPYAPGGVATLVWWLSGFGLVGLVGARS